ncbi:MAG: hypothetical protein LBB53_06220 [Prevotellaceae bacterium]|jgi:hypothetical protein|nr:hypothetical protein [Prevotellaceae bacterium]
MSLTVKYWLVSKSGYFVGTVAFICPFAMIVFIPLFSTPDLSQWDIPVSVPIVLTALLILNLIPSISVGKFTYRNINEILSRSARWRTSNVDVFEIRMKYALKKFFHALIILFAMSCYIALVIYVLILNILN